MGLQTKRSAHKNNNKKRLLLLKLIGMLNTRLWGAEALPQSQVPAVLCCSQISRVLSRYKEGKKPTVICFPLSFAEITAVLVMLHIHRGEARGEDEGGWTFLAIFHPVLMEAGSSGTARKKNTSLHINISFRPLKSPVCASKNQN